MYANDIKVYKTIDNAADYDDCIKFIRSTNYSTTTHLHWSRRNSIDD